MFFFTDFFTQMYSAPAPAPVLLLSARAVSRKSKEEEARRERKGGTSLDGWMIDEGRPVGTGNGKTKQWMGKIDYVQIMGKWENWKFLTFLKIVVYC
jgi:hypothetical protein